MGLWSGVVGRGRWHRRGGGREGACSVRTLVHANVERRGIGAICLDIGCLGSNNHDEVVISVVVVGWIDVGRVVGKGDNLVVVELDDGFFAGVGRAGRKSVM
jgi:hypothetical protein